jgi:hypothetical protein
LFDANQRLDGFLSLLDEVQIRTKIQQLNEILVLNQQFAAQMQLLREQRLRIRLHGEY